jgi:sec-independent protein translocase protein TatA
MFVMGVPELIIIMAIIFVIFGAGKLPEIGGAIGKGIKSFKKATKDADAVDVTEPKDEESSETPSQES